VKRRLDLKEHADKGVYVQGKRIHDHKYFWTLVPCVF
jgi:hypothetical protein